MGYLFHEGGKSKKSANKTKKGGNFLGSIGELVAPTGWESFVTTAGLFALDRADASFRRVKKEKKNTMKGGHKSKAEKERMSRFRDIMGWRLVEGERSRKNERTKIMPGDTINSSSEKIIKYPDDDLINYIIEQVEIHKYKTPISVELYTQLTSNVRNKKERSLAREQELNRIRLVREQEERLKQELITQQELQRTERELEMRQAQFEQAKLVAEQFAVEAREAQKRADDAMFAARKASQELHLVEQKLRKMLQ